VAVAVAGAVTGAERAAVNDGQSKNSFVAASADENTDNDDTDNDETEDDETENKGERRIR